MPPVSTPLLSFAFGSRQTGRAGQQWWWGQIKWKAEVVWVERASNQLQMLYHSCSAAQAINLITSKCCHSYSTQDPPRWPGMMQSQGHVLSKSHPADNTTNSQTSRWFLLAGNLRNQVKNPAVMARHAAVWGTSGHVLRNPHQADCTSNPQTGCWCDFGFLASGNLKNHIKNPPEMAVLGTGLYLSIFRVWE